MDIEIYAYSPEENQRIGGLVGSSDGLIENCSVTGTINADRSYNVGGITAWNGGTIRNSISAVNITVTDAYFIGGIAGYLWQRGRLDGCVSTSDISGGYNTGGLAGGTNGGTVMDSYATGNITAQTAGGLIGYINLGPLDNFSMGVTEISNSIINCYATGRVSGGSVGGGLIGSISWMNDLALTVRDCHATGETSGGENAGGFIGSCNVYNGSITNCYATGTVNSSFAGGFSCALSSRTISMNPTGTVVDDSIIGGLTVSRCYASGNVTGVINAAGFGDYGEGVVIYECAALGDVTATGSNDMRNPRACGFGNGNTFGTSIERCYAAGNVQAPFDPVAEVTSMESFLRNVPRAYGFGEGTITNCYALGNVAGGVPMGFGKGALENCYYTGELRSGDICQTAGSFGNADRIYEEFTFNGSNLFWDQAAGSAPIWYEQSDKNATGKTTSEMQSPEFADLLNSGQSPRVWFAKDGGYPALGFEVGDITGANIAGNQAGANDGFPGQGGNDGNSPGSTGNSGTTDSGNSQNPSASTGNNGSVDAATPVNPLIYIGGGVVLLCLIAALILFIISRKSKKNGEKNS